LNNNKKKSHETLSLMQTPLNRMPMPKLLIEKINNPKPPQKCKPGTLPSTWKKCWYTSNWSNYFFCVVNTTLFLPIPTTETDVRTTRGEEKRERGKEFDWLWFSKKV